MVKWRNINDARCRECGRVIRVNMPNHLQFMHTVHECYWRCLVPACPRWFTSELGGISACLHLVNEHNFSEGRGYSFSDWSLELNGMTAGHSSPRGRRPVSLYG